jgi:hypothetical protein
MGNYVVCAICEERFNCVKYQSDIGSYCDFALSIEHDCKSCKESGLIACDHDGSEICKMSFVYHPQG